MTLRRKYAQQAEELSAVKPLRAVWAIARQWLVIAAAFAFQAALVDRFGPASWSPADLGAWPLGSAACLAAGSALTFFAIACKQHGLGVLMHDATHFRLLHPRRANDAVSNLCCAYPLGMVTASYRRGHLPHHGFTNRTFDPYWVRMVDDPDYRFPQPVRRFAALLLRDLAGLNGRHWGPILRAWGGWAHLLDNRDRWLAPADRLGFALFWGTVGAVAWATGTAGYLLLFWLAPMFTLLLGLIRLRTIAEHDLTAPGGDELACTRHVDGTWLERQAVAPLSVNHHVVHHLFPNVPHYHLARMHAILMTDADYRCRSQRWRRYFGHRHGLIGSLLG